MKTIITLLLVLFTVMNSFAQQFIDIVNAPLNPIGYIDNKNQLNVKGDIAFYNNGNEGFIYFDKNGQRVFNLLYTLYTNKEKARINRGTYLELDNQKKVVYKENFYFDNKTFYTYNPNGTISKIEVQGKYPSVTTYEYDNKKRKVKEIEQKNAKTTVTAYTYQTTGNRVVISASETVKENNQSKSRSFKYAYENGLLMTFTENGVEDNHTYTYDTKGNWVTNSFRFGNVNREFYYHSELGQWDKWRWIYKKTNTTYSPYLMIGNRQIRMLTIGFNDLDNFTDILIYEPLTATTLMAENAVTTNGLSQGTGSGKISTLKAKNFMYTSVKGNIKFFVEGDNKSGNLKQVFIGKTYVIYDASSSLTYWCRDFEKGKKFNVFEDLGKDALLWTKSEKNGAYFWKKGEYVSLSYTLGETLDNGSRIVYGNKKPVFVLENFTSSAQNTFYKAVPYSGQAIPKNTTSNTSQTTTTTTTTGSNTSEQTIETRYYNGKYTKETALQKANDFFNRTNGEKITFTKMEKKSDYQFVGNWIIKGADESLQSKIEYLFEDDGLKIKINEIVLNDTYGALKMDKNHKDEVARKTAENLYTSINDLYVKAVFVYLDINNNTLKNTTTTGSNTSGQSNVQNEIAEKPGASFNSSLPLYVKEVGNGVYYFYQNDKRIQDPIYHQPTSMHKNKGVNCYYRTDKDYYFYVPGTEKPNANGKYPMSGLRGKHIYTTISNDEQKFVFEGKTLKPQEYDLIISREKDGVLLLKEKGLMFEIPSYAFSKQNETVTHSASNSDALGSNSNIFIVFKENGEMVVAEKGKIQSNADWKITKENDRNFLINNVDGRKYRVGIYNLTKIGVIAPNAINLAQ